MQSTKKVLLYGLLLWLAWTSIVVTAYEMLPAAIAGSAFFVSMKTVLLAAFTIGLIVRYMKKVGGTGIFTAKEGAIIGLIWTAMMIIADMLHYVFMSDGFSPGTYFFMFATSYTVIPFITITLMGWLRHKRS